MMKRNYLVVCATIAIVATGILFKNCGPNSKTASKQNDSNKITTLRSGEGNRDDFDCSNTSQTGIPEIECLALLDFYDSTNGPNWFENTNWRSDQPVGTWYGIHVEDGHVYSISLTENALDGTIPISIGNLTSLYSISMILNNIHGSLPPSIGNLTQLQFLIIEMANLSGSIPQEIGDMHSLRYISFENNNLTGEIPSTIGNLNELSALDLEHNGLLGPIPSTIGNLSALLSLDIRHNKLSGSIPSSIGNLTQLYGLWLNNNYLAGSVPSTIGNLASLNYLDLSHNKLTGDLTPGHFSSSLDDEEDGHLILDHNCLNDLSPETQTHLNSLNISQFVFYPQNTQQQCLITAKPVDVGPVRPGGTTVDSVKRYIPQYDKEGNRIITRKLLKNEKMASAELDKQIEEIQNKIKKEIEASLTKEAETKE